MSRRARAIALYLTVAYGVTWIVWLPYVRAAVSGAPPPDPFLYYLAALGPLAGALAGEVYERGVPGVRDLLRRLASLRRAGWWAVVGLLTPLLLIPAALVPIALTTGASPEWTEFGITDRAPGIGPAAVWLLMILSYGVGEEAGWRGFLLPRLQAGRPALVATLLLTPIWAVWHLPAFAFREGYVGLGPGGITGFFLGLLAGAVVLTALYNASGGSVLAVALWHGTWNWVATSAAFQEPWVMTMTAIIMVAAPLIVWRWGASDLSPRRRTVVPGDARSE